MIFPYKNILDAKQFDRKSLEYLFQVAENMENIKNGNGSSQPLKWKILASMFYEPSTRTRLSFESAMHRLGWNVITVCESENSSLSKWESLEDNARILELYSDIIVMRHWEKGSVEITANNTKIPVINAWDGANQHPTQALLDVYTILKEKWQLDDLNIAIVGDLKHGRTTHSLVMLLSLFKDISFTFVAPDLLQMPNTILKSLEDKNISFTQTADYPSAIKNNDVLYVTRIQKERFENISDYNRVKDEFILQKDMLKNQKNITILHPLPRVNEIDPSIDSLPNAAYFRQAENGVSIRMALLYLLLQ